MQKNYQVRKKRAKFSAVGHHFVWAFEWLQGIAYQHISYLESHERKFCHLHQYVHWKADMSNFSTEEITVFNILALILCDIFWYFEDVTTLINAERVWAGQKRLHVCAADAVQAEMKAESYFSLLLNGLFRTGLKWFHVDKCGDLLNHTYFKYRYNIHMRIKKNRREFRFFALPRQNYYRFLRNHLINFDWQCQWVSLLL